MKIATFNINNINRRLPNLLRWLRSAKPDAVALQELKAPTRDFPIEAISKAGYGAVWRGQKTWNGVAILARKADPVLIRTALPGDPDDHEARYIEAAINGIVITSIYLPNGNPQPGPKFDYKLDWFKRLRTARREIHQAGYPGGAGGRLQRRADAARYLSDEVVGQGCADPAEEPRRIHAVGGAGLDRRDPRTASGKAALHASGTTSATAGRATPACGSTICCSVPRLAPRLIKAGVDRKLRGEEGASDHAPAWIVLR